VIPEWWNAKNPVVPKPERDSSSLSVKKNSFSEMKNQKLNKLPERLQGGEEKVPLNCLHRSEET